MLHHCNADTLTQVTATLQCLWCNEVPMLYWRKMKDQLMQW